MGILEGRVALVTGASSGIGRAAALRMAKEGATVIATARRKERLEALVKEITAAGGKAMAVSCDLAETAEIDQVVKEGVAEFGPISILANIGQGNLENQNYIADETEENALIFYKTGPLATMRFMQQCLPSMKEVGYGNIINTCSHSAVMGIPGFAGYEMAKEAIRALTRNAAMDWGQYGIVTNAILPLVLTNAVNLHKKALEVYAEIVKQTPVGYAAGPEDCAPLIAFLASRDAKFINGQFIGVDGGYRIFA